MQLSIILTTILNLFSTSPDLCAAPLLDMDGNPYTDAIGQTLSRYCKWAGPDAPVFDGDVCCVLDSDSAACWAPSSNGTCGTGVKRYCKHGERLSGGGVVCYKPYPDACALGHCVQAPQEPPPVLADLICCYDGECYEITKHEQWDCDEIGGTVVWCHDGMSNLDGTVTCFD